MFLYAGLLVEKFWWLKEKRIKIGLYMQTLIQLLL